MQSMTTSPAIQAAPVAQYRTLPRLVQAPGAFAVQVQAVMQATGTATSSAAAAPRTRSLTHLPLAAVTTSVVPTTTSTPIWHRIPRLVTAIPQATTVWGAVGIAPEPAKTFNCPFCLENVRQEERVVLAACGNESHGVCRECMGHYFKRLVTDGRVTKIECHICGASAASSEILKLTDADTLRKYERFHKMRQDHTVRECPKCSTLCSPATDEDDNPLEEMLCDECGEEFCYYHSNAHPGMPCAEYRKRMAREEQIAEQGALRNTKACPECGVRTEKTGGCNHMTCQRCNANWCWVCGMKLDDVTAHYYLGGPFACGQFEDLAPRSPLSYCLRCLTVPLQVVSMVLFLLLSLTMVVWFPVAFLLLAPCNLNPLKCRMQPSAWRCVLLCSVVLAYVPFVVFQVIWMVCAAVIWLCLWPCGVERRHLVYLARAPVIAILPVLICFQLLMEHFRNTVEFESTEADAADELLQHAADLEAASDGTSEVEAVSSLDGSSCVPSETDGD